VLAGKALAVLSYLAAALVLYALAGVLVGVIVWGFHPLVNLSGHEISALHRARPHAGGAGALRRPGARPGQLRPVLVGRHPQQRRGDRGNAVLRDGAPGPLCTVGDQPRPARSCSWGQFTAWHDLFQTPTAGDAILRSVWVSAAFALPPLLAAWAVFTRRDVTS